MNLFFIGTTRQAVLYHGEAMKRGIALVCDYAHSLEGLSYSDMYLRYHVVARYPQTFERDSIYMSKSGRYRFIAYPN